MQALALSPQLGLLPVYREPKVNEDCHKWCSVWNPKTGNHSGFFADCKKLDLCDYCAQQQGIEYKLWIETAQRASDIYVAILTGPELEAFRRKHGGTTHYRNFPVQDGMHLVFHDIPNNKYSEPVSYQWIDGYNWTELARQKDTSRYVTGKLGTIVATPDNKQSYRNYAFKFNGEVKETGTAILRSAAHDVFSEHGPADSAVKAEQMTGELRDRVTAALASNGISESQYTLTYVYSRDEFDKYGILVNTVQKRHSATLGRLLESLGDTL